MRGGRRTEAEKAEGRKCYNDVDPLTLEDIPEEYAFRLSKRCWDIRSLYGYIVDHKKNIDPHTSKPFTPQDYVKINKKLEKLGLSPIPTKPPLNKYIFKCQKFFYDKFIRIEEKFDYKNCEKAVIHDFENEFSFKFKDGPFIIECVKIFDEDSYFGCVIAKFGERELIVDFTMTEENYENFKAILEY